MKTLAILTNGGDTCALNASIKSIRDSAYKIGYKKIYGIRRGYQGLLDNWIDDITLREIDVRIGGSCLGSMRMSPTDPCTEEEKNETRDTHKINEKRKSLGMSPLPIVTINMVLSEDHYPISSTRIWFEEIDREGHLL